MKGDSMMKNPQVLFVKQFLANLFEDDVKMIPINNELFKNGLSNMAEYFFEHMTEFGPYSEKLEMLFLRYTTRGDYSDFSKIIESFNGRLVSLENPKYIRAYLKFQDGYEKQLIQDKQLEIPMSEYRQLVLKFREGAKI